jgi:fatty-acyl-CoA synthase
MLTHNNIGNNGYWIGYHQGFTEKDRLCLPVPLFHCFGCSLGIMAAVNHGSALVILEGFKPVPVMLAIEKERCTALYGVPTMFIAILEHPLFDRIDFSSLRTGIMAGSVCPEPLMRRAVDKMNLREITNVYGLTESSPGMTQTHRDEEFTRRVSTVGRAMPGIEVRVADPETCVEVPHGQPGEVLCRGYNVMKGYYNMPEETAAAISPDGWLHSGDIGVMDEEGYLVITGRIKDMIIRGGENIYPKELEEFLSTMEGVLDVQVVAAPSEKYGEEVAAFVIPRSGADVTPEDVRDFCRGRIAWHKIPRYVALVDAFPLTASGKVKKFMLRKEAAKLVE